MGPELINAIVQWIVTVIMHLLGYQWPPCILCGAP